MYEPLGPMTPQAQWPGRNPGLAAGAARHSRNAWHAGRGFFRGPGHAMGVEWTKDMFGQGKTGWGTGTRGLSGFAGRWAGPAVTGYLAVQGYREGGVGGAAWGVARGAGESYLLGRAFSWLGRAGSFLGPTALAVGAVGGGLYARKQMINRAREHNKKQARIEMGTPIIDHFGTVATMRQRSINAIQNSRLNGRTAMGNEAALMYQPYFR